MGPAGQLSTSSHPPPRSPLGHSAVGELLHAPSLNVAVSSWSCSSSCHALLENPGSILGAQQPGGTSGLCWTPDTTTSAGRPSAAPSATPQGICSLSALLLAGTHLSSSSCVLGCFGSCSSSKAATDLEHPRVQEASGSEMSSSEFSCGNSCPALNAGNFLVP